MAEKLSVPILKKRLDTLLKVVRYYGSHDGVTNTCATCATKLPVPIKNLQCGHFIKRGNQALKYVSINLMPQCRRCNHYLDGAQDKAAYYILKKYGEGDLKWLVESDIAWQRGELSAPHKKELEKYYNYWLRENRRMEQKWQIQLVPKSWKELAD